MAQNYENNGQPIDMNFPSTSTIVEPRLASPSNMSIVVATTVTRDQLNAIQPTYEEQSEEYCMQDQDEPILHTELRLNGCLKSDGKMGPLKSLHIHVEDDDDISQHKPGSPQRTISVTMSDQRRTSDVKNQNPNKSWGKDVGVRKHLLWRNPNIVVEAPFNVHNYQARMLRDQPQGLAVALAKVMPEILPPSKEPQGLQAVLSFDNSMNKKDVDQEMIRKNNDMPSNFGDYEEESILSQEHANILTHSSAFEALCSPFHDSMDCKNKSCSSEYLEDGEEQREMDFSGTILPLTHDSNKLDNLHILRSLPRDLVSLLVKSHSNKLATSEHSDDSERRGRDSSHKYSYEKILHKSHAVSPNKSRNDLPDNVIGSNNMSYFTNSDSHIYGLSQCNSIEDLKKSKKIRDITQECEHDHKEQTSTRRSRHHNEQLKDDHKEQRSTRHTKHQVNDTHDSTYISNWTTSSSHDNDSYQALRYKKKSKNYLKNVHEKNEIQYDDPPPSPACASSSIESNERDRDFQRIQSLRNAQHRAQKSSHLRDIGDFVSFQSSDVSDRHSYNSTYCKNSHGNLFQERQQENQTPGSDDLSSNKVKETEAKMLSISRLLDNMSSIAQLLSKISQHVPEKNQSQNLRSSQDFQGTSNLSTLPQQLFLSNNEIEQFDNEKKQSYQILIEDAPQANQISLINSQNANYLDDKPHQPPSISTIVPTKLDNMQNIKPSEACNDNFSIFDVVNNQPSQHFSNQSSQQSSSLMSEDTKSQMNMQDLDFQQYSESLDYQLIYPNMQKDDSILLGTMNRPSELNVWNDIPSQRYTMEGKAQYLNYRLSQKNIPSNNPRQSLTDIADIKQSINSRPSHVGSQDKDLQLFDTMSNQASPLATAQQQNKKLSQQQQSKQFDGGEKISSQLQNTSQQALSIDNHPLQNLKSKPSQTEQQNNTIQQVEILDDQILLVDKQVGDSQMLENLSSRTSQLQRNNQEYLNTQGQKSNQFETLEDQHSQLFNIMQSQLDMQHNNPRQLDAYTLNIQPTQLNTRIDNSQMFENMNNKVSQFDNKKDLQQFNLMNAQPSHLLNNRLSQMYLKNDDLQQIDVMDNQPSTLMNTRQSQTNIQNDDSQEFNVMSFQSPHDLLLDARLSHNDLQQLHAINGDAQPSELLVTRLSQMNLPQNELSKYDIMNVGSRASPLLETRPSKVNFTPFRRLNTTQSQINMQSDMQFNPSDSQISQFMYSRPSQTDTQEDGFQQFDSMDQQPSQILNTRKSHMAKQDDNIQQFDTKYSQRPSQVLITRPLTDTLYNDIQQLDPLNRLPSVVKYTRPLQIKTRHSQLLNTRPSQTILHNGNLQQLDPMDYQQSEILNTRQSQFDMQNIELQQSDPMNHRLSQQSNTRPSHIHMQDDGQQKVNLMSHGKSLENIISPGMDMRSSQSIDVRPSQISLQDDNFQQFDSTNPRQSEIFDTRLSHSSNMHDDYTQEFDLMNQRSSELSQLYSEDGNQKHFDPMNPQDVNLQYVDPQDDNLQYSDHMYLPSSQFKESQSYQHASFRPSQSNLQQRMFEVCDNCFELDHDTLSCPIQGCSNCHELGHYAQACVKPKVMKDNRDYAIPVAIQQQEALTQQYENDEIIGANMTSENIAQMDDLQEDQVLESLSTIDDDNQNLQTRDIGILKRGTYSNYTSTK